MSKTLKSNHNDPRVLFFDQVHEQLDRTQEALDQLEQALKPWRDNLPELVGATVRVAY